jgi:hypothetical protein
MISNKSSQGQVKSSKANQVNSAQVEPSYIKSSLTSPSEGQARISQIKSGQDKPSLINPRGYSPTLSIDNVFNSHLIVTIPISSNIQIYHRIVLMIPPLFVMSCRATSKQRVIYDPKRCTTYELSMARVSIEWYKPPDSSILPLANG